MSEQILHDQHLALSDGTVWTKQADRKLRIKLDAILMTFTALAYTIKFLDQFNYTYAYASGMKEELGLYGDELNWMGTIFSIGYILGTIPSQLLLTRIRPSYFLSTVEMCWGVFVLAMAGAKSVDTIYAMRFLIGFFEAAAYPGLLAILASWYTPRELGKRVAILQSSSALGAMWAGYLQAAVFAGLDGAHGLPGWKWGFIVNGAITIPIGAMGFYCLPDFPTTTKARWLTIPDIALAQERMCRANRAAPSGWTRRTFRRVFTSWPLYAFVLPYCFWVINGQATSFFILWLKDTKRFSTVTTNLIPTGGFAFQIVTALIWAAISDATNARWPMIIVSGLFGLFGAIVLTVWHVSFELHFVAHLFIFGTVGGSALILTWVSEITGGDAEARILIVAILNTMCYVFNAALPFAMYPASQAPHYKWGYQISTGFWIGGILGIALIAFYLRTGRAKPFIPTEEADTADEPLPSPADEKDKDLEYPRQI